MIQQNECAYCMNTGSRVSPVHCHTVWCLLVECNKLSLLVMWSSKKRQSREHDSHYRTWSRWTIHPLMHIAKVAASQTNDTLFCLCWTWLAFSKPWRKNENMKWLLREKFNVETRRHDCVNVFSRCILNWTCERSLCNVPLGKHRRYLTEEENTPSFGCTKARQWQQLINRSSTKLSVIYVSSMAWRLPYVSCSIEALSVTHWCVLNTILFSSTATFDWQTVEMASIVSSNSRNVMKYNDCPRQTQSDDTRVSIIALFKFSGDRSVMVTEK
jgi:hypothetical protein